MGDPKTDRIQEQLLTAGLARRIARDTRKLAVELTKDAIIAARDSGISVRQMADALGITIQAVYQVIAAIDNDAIQRGADGGRDRKDFLEHLHQRHEDERELYKRLAR